MKRLFLLRHAKAEPGSDDHERELTARGAHDAAAMGRFMDKKRWLPEMIYCSTAQRTRQTADLLLREWGSAPAIEYRQALYLADAKTLAATVRAAPDVASLLIIGHNPGLEKCAALLVHEAVKPTERDALDHLEEKFPTAALAVLDFDIAVWREASPHNAALTDFIRPRDL